MFLIQVLFKIYGNHLWIIPSIPKHVSFSVLIRNWWTLFLKYASASNAYCLFNSSWKLANILYEASLIFQSVLPSQFLFEIDENTLWSIASLFSQSMFLIQFLFKVEEHSLKHPSCSKACFSFSSYWKFILIATPLAARRSPQHSSKDP